LSFLRHVIALAALLLTGGARAEPPLKLPEIDYVLVDKSDRTMWLYAGGQAVHTITGLQLGDAPEGPKRFQGDERTPEGLYTLDYGNPNSGYHLSLHVSYPSAADRAFAEAQGRNPGGLIFIHGQPNDWPAGRVPGDWTDGCIAVSDEEIEALWAAIPDGTPIEIRP
jgi:murein L,D-transpeptidase YafK